MSLFLMVNFNTFLHDFFAFLKYANSTIRIQLCEQFDIFQKINVKNYY